MTCIIAIKNKKTKSVLLAGDNTASNGHSKDRVTNSKVFTLMDGKIGVGYTTSFRMGQILEHLDLGINGDELKDREVFKEPAIKTVITCIIPAIRRVLRDLGFTSIESNVENSGQFLLIYRGHIFNVQSDLSVLESSGDYDSVGSGAETAKGSLYTTSKINDSPDSICSISTELQISLAMHSAENNITTVGSKYNVIEL